MKVIWKKQNISSKKSSLAAVSHFPNLPFEHEEEEDDQAQQNHQTNYSTELEKHDEKDDGLSSQNQDLTKTQESHQGSDLSNAKQLTREFEAQGNKFAEEGKYREALGKWEAALTLMPENAVLHEQKAQILLEFGDAWQALKAATRATELESSWAEAWLTLGRAQLNFGEPDSAIESFDRALAIKPDSEEARDDRKTALHLVKKRKQLQLSGLSTTENRFMVSDKDESRSRHVQARIG